jgi:hypothetical protein
MKSKRGTGIASYLGSVTRTQAKDFGIALSLACVIAGLFSSKPDLWLSCAAAALLITALVPVLLNPFAALWFALAGILANVASAILLSVIFYVFITPLGILRRAFGSDLLGLKKWKKGAESVFFDRNKEIRAEDVRNPF